MADVNVAVIYYSSTGTNYRVAQAAVEAAKQAGASVRLRRVEELAPDEAIAKNPDWQSHREATKNVVQVATLDDLDWADAVIFHTPTRYGIMAAQMKQFLDSAGPLWAQGKLVNKVVTATSSAANSHGGQEQTIHSVYTVMAHWGAIIVPPGYADPSVYAAGGNPYGTSANAGAVTDEVLAAVRFQVKRATQVAEWVKAGQRVGAAV